MQALTKNKTALKILGIFILMVLAYNIFFKSDPAAPAPVAVSPSVLGADLLKMSTELSKATLSQELFSSQSYLYLTDFTTILPQQPVGRTNPFESLGL